MFGLFKRKKDNTPREKKLELTDLNQEPLTVGDRVESLRYDLGPSVIIEEEGQVYYQSEASGVKIHWTKMIDASTQFQKVRKIERQE